MTFVLHIAMALLFSYLYRGPLKRVADALLGQPLPASAVSWRYIRSLSWTWTYLRGLVFIVLVPAMTAELLVLAFPAELAGGRRYLLLPHFLMLLLDPRILPLVRHLVRVGQRAV